MKPFKGIFGCYREETELFRLTKSYKQKNALLKPLACVARKQPNFGIDKEVLSKKIKLLKP